MFSKRDIVVVNFPFSDLINAKKRPMLVLAERGEDLVGCAITSNLSVEGILLKNFQEGCLPFESKVKYWQIHTFLKSLATKKIGKISKENYNLIVEKITNLIS